MTKCPTLSKSAQRKIIKLATEAAKKDGWMEPTEEHVEDEFDEYQMYHRDGWESTCHFELRYLATICDITEEDALKQGVDRSTDWETWYNEFQDLAKDIFWDTWEEEVNLYKYWEDHHASQSV